MSQLFPHKRWALPRCVGNEELDHLAPDDPQAVRSRQDLYRINRLMRSRAIIVQALSAMSSSTPQHIVELGCGDGRIMLDVARSLHRQWPKVHLTLLDQQALVNEQTLQALIDLGWQVKIVTQDVISWARTNEAPVYDLIFCNLFIHHFKSRDLVTLLHALSLRTQAFFACEPRRARVPLLGSHLVGLIGANAVTRSDAVLSVHAGFCDNEISAAWHQSSPQQWRSKEYCAGLFSHCFLAMRESL